MSRLFGVTKSLEEIVAHFAVDMAPTLEVPSETVEGTPGLIVLEKDGLRLLKSVPWGFPRQTRDMRREGEPPSRIGLVADLTKSALGPHRRRPQIPLPDPAHAFCKPRRCQRRENPIMVLEEPATLDGLGGVCQEHPRLRPGVRRHDHDRKREDQALQRPNARFARAARIRPLASRFDRRCDRLPVSRSAVVR